MTEIVFKTSAEKTQKMLKQLFLANLQRSESGKKSNAIEIIGQPGIGKTYMMQSLAHECGMDFVSLPIAQFADQGDLMGMPMGAVEMEKDGERRYFPEVALSVAASDGWKITTGKAKTIFGSPEWMSSKPMVLLLDDWTRANQQLLQACMQLIQDGRYGSWELPKGSTVVLTSNPEQDGNNMYDVSSIDAAVQSRMYRIQMDFDVQVWAAWAERAEVPEPAINFMLKSWDDIKSKCKDATINARTMTMFFDTLENISGDYASVENISYVNDWGSASVGPQVTQMFIAFIREKLHELPTGKELYEMDEEKLCKKLSDLNCSSPAISNVLCTRLINYTMKRMDDKAWNAKKDIPRLQMLLTKDGVFHKDNQYFAASSLYKSNYKAKLMGVFTGPLGIKLAKDLITIK